MNFMKKNFKLIVGIIIGAVLISGISVYATGQYYATQINYTRNNETVTVAEALNDLYSQKLILEQQTDIKFRLDSQTAFGGTGTSFSGFTEGHKYLALYASNQLPYGDNSWSHFNSGATDIHLIRSAISDGRSGVCACGAMLTFTATASTVSITWENSQNYFMMYFIDIT